MPVAFRHFSLRLPAPVPHSCALCGADGDAALCDGCHRQFFVVRRHRCRQCATPLPQAAAPLCGQCMQHPPAFDATVTAVDYAPPVDRLVLTLKFGNQLALAPLLARMMHDAAGKAPMALPALLCAVPLGPDRLAERGFNQALEIARPLSRAFGARLDAKLLTRVRDTRSQALLHPDERRRNIRNAFVVSGHAIGRLQGEHIGVVDDVITTGETLNEVAATLKRFGAARVTNFVFARTESK